MQQYTWIYSLTRPVTAAEAQSLRAQFEAFLGQWKTHGEPVHGLIDLRYDRFVIIQTDPSEGRPSGCSIDSLRRAVTDILQQAQLAWAEAAEIFYRDQAGDIQSVNFQQLDALAQSGAIGPETIVFDHSLNQSDDLSRWELPLKDTWMKRFLPTKPKQKA